MAAPKTILSPTTFANDTTEVENNNAIAETNVIKMFFILITTYVILDFISLIGYALLAQKLITWIKANPKTINTISASVLVIIALIIIVTQQY